MVLPAPFVMLLLLGCAFVPGALGLLLCRKFRVANILEWLFAAVTLVSWGSGGWPSCWQKSACFHWRFLIGIWVISVVVLGVLVLRRDSCVRR